VIPHQTSILNAGAGDEQMTTREIDTTAEADPFAALAEVFAGRRILDLEHLTGTPTRDAMEHPVGADLPRY
jgi:hypothetical protein